MAEKPPIDALYLRSREDLLEYEDARLNSLIQAVANYYTTRNDQSMWGQFLRAMAIELAKLEWAYVYDLIGKDPQYLTPPDIKRRFAAPLELGRNYPSKDQFDLQFRDMIVRLVKAYRQGSTPKALAEVIYAYTGKAIVVEELFRAIGAGNGFYDQSYRNTIRVAVKVGGNNPLTDIQNLLQLQQITRDLYGAIDLGKPAHVGVDFTTVFGEDEDLDLYIMGSGQNDGKTLDFDLAPGVDITDKDISGFERVWVPDPNTGQPALLNEETLQYESVSVTHSELQNTDGTKTVHVTLPGVQDLLRIFVQLEDTEPFDPLLYQQNGRSVRDPEYPNTPDTRLSAVGRKFPLTLTQVAYATYPVALKAEYEQQVDGSYKLKDEALNWTMLTDSKGNLTGEISKAEGILAPRLNTVWEISDEEDSIFELD